MNKYLKFLTFSIVILGGGKTLNISNCLAADGHADNNVQFLETSNGVVFPNNAQMHAITEDSVTDIKENENFVTTARNNALKNEYEQLRYDINTEYQMSVNPHTDNYLLLYDWVGQMYTIAERFTHLVERIEKNKSVFEEDELNTEFSRSYLMSIADVINLSYNGPNMKLKDILNYLSSKLYMQAINILKEMQRTIAITKQINPSNDDWNEIKDNFNKILSNCYYEVFVIKKFWEVFLSGNVIASKIHHKDPYSFDNKSFLNTILPHNAFDRLRFLKEHYHL